MQEREAHRQLQGGVAGCVYICETDCDLDCLGQGDECMAECSIECALGCSEEWRRRRLQQPPAHLQRGNDTNNGYLPLSPYPGPHYGDYLHDNHTANSDYNSTSDYEEEPSAAGSDRCQLGSCHHACHNNETCTCILGHWNEWVGCEDGLQVCTRTHEERERERERGV